MPRRALVFVAIAAVALVGLPAGAEAGPAVHPTEHERLEGLPAAPSSGQALQAQAGGTSAPVRTPMPFDMVGFESPSGADVWVRTSVDGRTWSAWHESEALDEDDDGPDLGSPEHRGEDWRRMTEPVWVGEARWIQVRLDGGNLDELGVELLDSSGHSRSTVQRMLDAFRTAWRGTHAAAHASVRKPAVVSRAQWGADESKRNGGPYYASRVRYGVVHHTAGSNDYTREQAPAVVRGIYHYHTQSLGWNDIGYNILVDRYGTVYEGRYGGLDRGVIGAHARGFNTGSFGISVLGRFSSSAPPLAAREAVARTIAWKFAVHGIDPEITITVTSGGSDKWPAGTEVTMPTIVGHRDVGRTECPGNAYYPHLPALRERVAELMPEGQFYDVNPHSVHAPDIYAIFEAGITKGCTTRLYCPDRAVTREQMASFIRRATGIPQRSGSYFLDVSSSSTHAPDIYGIAAANITKGCQEDRYCPKDDVTRAQMASFLMRALDLQPVDEHPFIDVGETTHTGAIGALYAAGITKGCQPDRYCPNRPVTRAEMATFIQRALERGL